MCKNQCVEKLDCGHLCPKRCCDECPSQNECNVKVSSGEKCPKNHLVKIPCGKKTFCKYFLVCLSFNIKTIK